MVYYMHLLFSRLYGKEHLCKKKKEKQQPSSVQGLIHRLIEFGRIIFTRVMEVSMPSYCKVLNRASKASPTLGCSIEILRDIYTRNSAWSSQKTETR